MVAAAAELRSRADEIAINDIIYAELSVRYQTIEALDKNPRG
jgi:hypothetical protein